MEAVIKLKDIAFQALTSRKYSTESYSRWTSCITPGTRVWRENHARWRAIIPNILHKIDTQEMLKLRYHCPSENFYTIR